MTPSALSSVVQVIFEQYAFEKRYFLNESMHFTQYYDNMREKFNLFYIYFEVINKDGNECRLACFEAHLNE